MIRRQACCQLAAAAVALLGPSPSRAGVPRLYAVEVRARPGLKITRAGLVDVSESVAFSLQHHLKEALTAKIPGIVGPAAEAARAARRLLVVLEAYDEAGYTRALTSGALGVLKVQAAVELFDRQARSLGSTRVTAEHPLGRCLPVLTCADMPVDALRLVAMDLVSALLRFSW
jgi:hypothetical protein